MTNTNEAPQTMADIAARVDAMAARRAELQRIYNFQPVNAAPLFTATADQIAEAMRRLLDVGK